MAAASFCVFELRDGERSLLTAKATAKKTTTTTTRGDLESMLMHYLNRKSDLKSDKDLKRMISFHLNSVLEIS